MSRTTIVRMITAVLIAVVLGAAYLIVVSNSAAAGSEGEAPAGFLH